MVSQQHPRKAAVKSPALIRRTLPRGADHNVMRELNRSLVLDVLKRDSPVSRASIAKSTGLAKPTVSAIVEDLIAQGLVRELGIGEAGIGGGRPPLLLEFNALSACVAGVQIGVNWTTVVLADARGREIARRRTATAGVSPETATATIVVEVKEMLRANRLPLGKLTAVGVVLPGLIDVHSGTCILAPNLGWRDTPIRDLLRHKLPSSVAVFLHNTAQAVAVAESLEGAGEGAENLALLYAGSGIGSGVLSDGQIFHGSGGTAGEIGHCRIPGAVEACNCGKKGCLETVAAGPAIVRAAHAAVAAGQSPALAALARKTQLSTADVAQAAAAGDPVATKLITDAGRELGLAASWLINMYNPAVLVIGGGLVEIGDLLLGPLRAAVAENALAAAAADVQIRTSRLGQDAEVRGALLLALQQSEPYYRVVFQG